MDGDRALWASWISVTMTCLATAAGFLAALLPQRRELFICLVVVFLIGAALSLREAVKARRAKAPPEKTEDVFGPGLELVHHESTYGPVLGKHCHLHVYRVRIHRPAAIIRFDCHDPLHHAHARFGELMAVADDLRYETRRSRPNWADVVFNSPEVARGSLLIMELASITPLVLRSADIVK